MAELPVGTVTFLFTDIEGSTQLLKELGPRYADALAEHQRILRDACTAHGGREVDTQGDSFFVAFGRAKDAVAAAADAQRDLAAHPWPAGAPVKVRMGLHTGEPRLGGERYVGLGVHKAARIAAAGHGGQVLLSRTTRELVEDELPPGVSIRDLGERRLKDLDRPEHLSQLVVEGLQSDFARLKTLDEDLRRKRRLMYGGSALIGVVAAAIAIPIFALGQSGSTSSVEVAPNSLAVIDPGSNTVVRSVPVGIRPSQIVTGAGSIWVANVDDQSVSRVDPGTFALQRTITPLPTPTGLAFGEGSVWVASGPAGNVTRIDPGLNQPEEPLPVTELRGGFGVVAAGSGSVWAVLADSQLYRIDPAGTRAPQPGGVVGAAPAAIVAAEGSVWVASAYDNTVQRVLPKTGTVVKEFNVGRHPIALAVGDGAVWVADQLGDDVTRIDPASGSERTINLAPGAGPTGIAFGAGAVWTANAGDGTVSRIDPGRPGAMEVIPVGNRPSGIAFADGRVWVSVQAST